MDSDQQLDRLRNRIDKIDEQLSLLLEKRYALIKQIAQVKKSIGLPIQDCQREEKVIGAVLSGVSNESAPFVSEIYHSIIKASRSVQD